MNLLFRSVMSLASSIPTSLQRIHIAAKALQYGFPGSGLMSWSPGLEGGSHSFGGWRDSDMAGQHDLPRWKFVSINLPVGAIVRANGRSFERDSCKRAAGARIAQDVRTQGGVCFCRSGATDRACGDRCIGSQLHFARENSARTPLVHYEQNKVCCLAT